MKKAVGPSSKAQTPRAPVKFVPIVVLGAGTARKASEQGEGEWIALACAFYDDQCAGLTAETEDGSF